MILDNSAVLGVTHMFASFFIAVLMFQGEPPEVPPEVLSACTGPDSGCESEEIDLTGVISAPIGRVGHASGSAEAMGGVALSARGSYYKDFAYCRTNRATAASRTENAVHDSFRRNSVVRLGSRVTSNSTLQTFVGHRAAGGEEKFYYVDVDLSRVPETYAGGRCQVHVDSTAWRDGNKHGDHVSRGVFAAIRDALTEE